MKLTLGLTVFALAATAGSLCMAQSLPPIRQLGPVTTVAKEPLGAVSTVRHLPDGRVLVNDILGRRIVMFDSTLSTVTVIADTTSATAGAYGIRPGGLIAYRGDSTLFVDPASLSMLVIDPNGKIARVIAAPRAQDVGFLVGGPFGNPGFDPMGRLIYRAPPNFAAMRPPPTSGARLPQFPTLPDSAALVRYDLTTRKVDTVTFFKTPKFNMNVTRSPDGGIRVSSMINPLPQGDDWVLLSDGTIALVRAKDYHVDLLNPDGTMTSSPKIPFQWERLTDEAKVATIYRTFLNEDTVEKLDAKPLQPFLDAVKKAETRDDITRNATTNPPDRVKEFSYKAGGGVDFHISHRWEIRVIDLDYYRTSFGTNMTQNNYWASAGVVLRLFGSRASE